jgi:hypothetical protein
MKGTLYDTAHTQMVDSEPLRLSILYDPSRLIYGKLMLHAPGCDGSALGRAT